MNKKNNFEQDLKRGKYYENKAISILQSKGFTDIYQYEGNVPYYDLHATYKNKKVYIEVKYNSKADTYKSFIIELCKTDGTPSGLTITKSNYYMLFGYKSYWLIKTKRLHIIVKKYILNKLRIYNIFQPTPEEYEQYILNECKTYNNYKYMVMPYESIKKHNIFNGIHNNI